MSNKVQENKRHIANYQNDFSCKECADGVYYYVLKAKSKRNGREKEYKGSLTIING